MLACCLLDGGVSLLSCANSGISSESFYDPACRVAFEQLCSMRETGQPIDVAVLAEELRKANLLDAVGGFVWINRITSRAPTTAYLNYYIEQVRDMSGLRNLIAVCTAGIDEAYTNQGDVAALAARVEQRVLSATRSVESKLPPIRDMADNFKTPPPKPDEVICQMLHRRGLMNIGGMSKARKSWVLLNLALAVATGSPWLGLETKQGKVLILNFEIDAGFYTERASAVAESMGVALPKGSIDCWDLRGYACDIAKLRPAIEARMVGANYDLVIIDPLYMLIGERDESNAGDMTDMMNEFSQMAVRGNTAIAFATHFAKGNAATKNSIDRASGSGVLARYPDVVATLTEHEQEDCVTFEVTVRNNKPIPKAGLRWAYPMFHRDDSLDPSQLRGLEKEKKEKRTTERHEERRPQISLAEVAQYFPASKEVSVGLGEAKRSAEGGSCISGQAFQRFRNQLLEAGWIEQDQECKWKRTALGDEFVFDWKNSNSYQQRKTDGSEQ